ncbi:hypothetical protein H0W26_02670 [Candidatus Dependentiae bacterium]|nr:hypothetical protein [Candidatus Dependentiae bacterium]
MKNSIMVSIVFIVFSGVVAEPPVKGRPSQVISPAFSRSSMQPGVGGRASSAAPRVIGSVQPVRQPSMALSSRGRTVSGVTAPVQPVGQLLSSSNVKKTPSSVLAPTRPIEVIHSAYKTPNVSSPLQAEKASYKGLWEKRFDLRSSSNRFTGSSVGPRWRNRNPEALSLRRPLKKDVFRNEARISKQYRFLGRDLRDKRTKWSRLYRHNWPLFISTFPFAYYETYGEYPPIYYDYYDTYGVYPQRSVYYTLLLNNQSKLIDQWIDQCSAECGDECIADCQKESGKSWGACKSDCDPLCKDACEDSYEDDLDED